MYQILSVAFVTEVSLETGLWLATKLASTTVASMETVVQITIVTAILAGWVKTAPLIVAVMGTVIAHKASAFVTNAKIILMVTIVSSAFLAHLVMQPPLKGANHVSVMVTAIQRRIYATWQLENVSAQISPWATTVIRVCLVF